jgi:hypothetical protein
MVRQPVHVPVPPSGLVTVTFRTPGEPPTIMVRLMAVAVRLASRTVIPLPPEKVTLLPATNPVPLIVTDFSRPLEIDDGEALTGFGNACTCTKTLVLVPTLPATSVIDALSV